MCPETQPALTENQRTKAAPTAHPLYYPILISFSQAVAEAPWQGFDQPQAGSPRPAHSRDAEHSRTCLQLPSSCSTTVPPYPRHPAKLLQLKLAAFFFFFFSDAHINSLFCILHILHLILSLGIAERSFHFFRYTKVEMRNVSCRSSAPNLHSSRASKNQLQAASEYLQI